MAPCWQGGVVVLRQLAGSRLCSCCPCHPQYKGALRSGWRLWAMQRATPVWALAMPAAEETGAVGLDQA